MVAKVPVPGSWVVGVVTSSRLPPCTSATLHHAETVRRYNGESERGENGRREKR